MRYLIALWAIPLALFWGWYFLSLNDMNFGYLMLSRRLHDFVFKLYGEMLGVDPVDHSSDWSPEPAFSTRCFCRQSRLPPAAGDRGLGRVRPRALFRGRPSHRAMKPVEYALQDEGRCGRVDLLRPLLARQVHLQIARAPPRQSTGARPRT